MNSDRRYRVPRRPLDRCRLCWAPMTPDPDQVEIGEQFIYYHCPRCLGSFPIRQSDLALMDSPSK